MQEDAKQSFMQKMKAFVSHGNATISKTYAHNWYRERSVALHVACGVSGTNQA
jgi:hypothetical protein